MRSGKEVTAMAETSQGTAARPAPLFGISVAPWARDAQQIVETARLADTLGLDLIGIQDHPYNGGFLDTWTLLAALGGMTTRLRLLPDVLNLPLRPPALLAKAAATLDLLTNGRVELGLGAGAAWDNIAGYGGPRRTPGEALAALEEAIQILRALWEPSASGQGSQGVTVAGKHYQITDAQPGPAPAHRIGIWIGGYGPRMLDLIGRRADGWIPSAPYAPPSELPAKQAAIDTAARAAGRAPASIRRAYNMGGVVLAPGDPATRPARPGVLVGPAALWTETLVSYYRDLGLDTFIFWPAGGQHERQIRAFAEEIAPAVRQAVGA
jgi:alkanesulfonate monooxygenase SsuD/methylene tetrahydromethanopterin reductase-like flavin-dependent oxidoreductase (luciferase family)